MEVFLNLPVSVIFNSDLFRAELADVLELPVDSVRITTNTQLTVLSRTLEVANINLTAAKEAELINLFSSTDSFLLPSFGEVVVGPSGPVSKTDDIVTLSIPDVCTSVLATGFPEDEYIDAFDRALEQASSTSVTTSIVSIEGDSASCDDDTPTRIQTQIGVAAADLGAVLDELPTASGSIDLGGAFGTVSLGDRLFLFN